MTLEEEILTILNEEHPDKNIHIQEVFNKSKEKDGGKTFVNAYNKYISKLDKKEFF